MTGGKSGVDKVKHNQKMTGGKSVDKVKHKSENAVHMPVTA